jgi:8-oxo-dGTP pyrophosphatase MutT (NUDIX family)
MTDEDRNTKALKKFANRISADEEKAVAKLVPAATVVVLRDTDQGLETLMLRKNSKIAFGGMWVFPGGKIDAEDGAQEDSMEQRARLAAVREAEEETALVLQPEQLVWFSHWTPPPMGNRRFATWFYVAPAPATQVTIDDGEITESQWISPHNAIDQHARGEIEFAPPTWVTIHYLRQYPTVSTAMTGLNHQEPRHYATRITTEGDDIVTLWEGDAGYDSSDPAVPGARHRLKLRAGGYQFDDSGIA